MNKCFTLITLIIITLINDISAQIVLDTFYNPLVPSTVPRPISNGFTHLETVVKYGQYELSQRGIVPGSIIHGISYNKGTSGYFLSGTLASFTVKFRSGAPDTIIIPYSTNPFISQSYIIDSFFLGGYINCTTFSLGNNLTIPASIGWLPPLMVDIPFIYTGGALDINTYWNGTQYSANGTVAFKYESLNGILFNCFCDNYTINSGNLVNNRPALIIYHTGPPPPCTGFPDGGTISGLTNVCINQLFTLYLNNPSAGPDITYQWQQSATSPISWSNIAGATGPSLKTSTASPTTYRCKVTCNNSGHFSYSNSFNIIPHYFNIDSVVASVTGNVVTINEYDNDTSFTIFRQYYTNTWDTLMSQTNPFSKIYTTDGTYNLIYTSANMCNADTVYGTVTIGCAGSPTFHDSIAANPKTVCPSGSTTLTLLNTLPANYTSEWQYYYWSGPISIPGLSGNSAIVSPSATTYYHHKGTCIISGNYKYSNWDTITITPPPTAGIIQATNTTTNYYNFTNTGMSNTQSYKWYFGDGDSSTSLAPSHHYNLAGTYNVWFVVTNAGNGCTDTAFTTVHITTGIEETQSKLFSVSPNPFKESFVVNCPSGKGTIIITDAVGKVVASYQLPVARGSQPTTRH